MKHYKLSSFPESPQEKRINIKALSSSLKRIKWIITEYQLSIKRYEDQVDNLKRLRSLRVLKLTMRTNYETKGHGNGSRRGLKDP